ncbi:MAG: Maf family nucleotide pyrophosphatase [bacterium]|nr:Maf family nucleotide pyrophosphatase [bacterium]
MKKIILASVSYRRRELLTLLIGNNFEVQASSYEEDNNLNLPPKELVLFHALEKGRDVASKLSEGVVISADVVVIFNNEIFGKPHTPEKAKEMLQKMSGQTVEVISGIAVIDIENKKELQDFEITKVKFKSLTEQEISDYVATGDPLDKAGGFGVQGQAAVFIERIEGDYPNILGLPLFKLNALLKQSGINIFDYKI